MTIRALWSFSHLPRVSATTDFARNSYGLTHVRIDPLYNPVASITADGGLLVYSSNTASTGGRQQSSLLNVACNLITDGVSPKSFIGMQLTYFLPPTYTSGLEISGVRVIARDDPALPDWREAIYLEIGIDRVNKVVEVYCDGVLVKTITGTDAVNICNGYGGTNNWRYGYFATNMSPSSERFVINNVYFSDEPAGATESAKLGPIKFIPLTPDTTVGTDWVSSDSGKSLNDVLNTAATTTALLTAPVINSAAPASPLDMTFTTTQDNALTIKAVQFLFDARRLTAETNAGVNIDYSGNNAPLDPPELVGTTLRYGMPTSVSMKAPDNTAWTIDKLKASKLTLSAS